MIEQSRKKTVGILTFHASHNYGSMLQAYALQKTVEKLGYDCEIINFRTQRQKDFYRPLWRQGSLYERLKRFVLSIPYIKGIRKKQYLFEKFLIEDLRLSHNEYTTVNELYNGNLNYDYYISGSDQIWNTLILDFDWAYFLPFVTKGKLIAYAPSMGPTPELTSQCDADKICSLLYNYSAISVRELRTSIYFKQLMNKDFPVVLDPTLLLDIEYWNNFAGKVPLIDGDYCFCYSPWMNEQVLDLAFTWAKKNKMKVVVSKPFKYLSSIMTWRDVVMFPAVGPKEFLNLCKYAKMVCCDSFHSVVFSIFFHTPFLALNGKDDARIANILKMTNLESRSVGVGQVVKNEQIDFDNAFINLERYKRESCEWLNWALKG